MGGWHAAAPLRGLALIVCTLLPLLADVCDGFSRDEDPIALHNWRWKCQSNQCIRIALNEDQKDEPVSDTAIINQLIININKMETLPVQLTQDMMSLSRPETITIFEVKTSKEESLSSLKCPLEKEISLMYEGSTLCLRPLQNSGQCDH